MTPGIDCKCSLMQRRRAPFLKHMFEPPRSVDPVFGQTR
jgi:hypothetical protein